MLLASSESKPLHSSVSGMTVVSDPVGEWAANMWLGMAERGTPLGMRMLSEVPAVDLGFSAMEGCLGGIKKKGRKRVRGIVKKRKTVDLDRKCVV